MADDKDGREPLVKPATVRALKLAAVAVMLLTVVIDVLNGHVGHFGFDGFPGVYALLGLVSGLVIIGIAKGLGVFLGRPDTYYGGDEGEAGR